MGGFDLEAHLLQRDDDICPRLFTPIEGGEIKVAPTIVEI
jgi:hypothetical protein